MRIARSLYAALEFTLRITFINRFLTRLIGIYYCLKAFLAIAILETMSTVHQTVQVGREVNKHVAWYKQNRRTIIVFRIFK